MRRSARALALLIAMTAVSLVPQTLHAQELDRIESLMLRGRFTDARSALTLWKEQNPRAAADEQAHALLLTAQLATDVEAATEAYLSLALTYPTSQHAPTALLRLAQGLLTTGEAERARVYLERLVRDYPNASDRAHAMLWLARAERASGRDAAACATVRDARTLTTTEATRDLLAAEELRACAS